MSLANRLGIVCALAGILAAGCQTGRHLDSGNARVEQAAEAPFPPKYTPPPETLKRIMALDPEHVTGQEIREVLAGAPAPRIINIHGGLLPLQGSMTSFSEFLVGMGYPRTSLQSPRDGSYALGYYVRSERIGGMLAWYYEHEGLRPMMVGHSQGGIQAVKVLYKLAGESTEKIPVWNPLTWKPEPRYDFIDPLTGRNRPVVGFRIPYATVVAAGGLGRALPNQWEMNGKLRRIPDSVEEFTGFQKGLDILGGDFFGYGPANEYKPIGTARVRNVRLPATEAHTTLPRTRHLLKSQQIKDWINHYHPKDSESAGDERMDLKFDSDSSHILWAADVWYSVKKHWVLELQQLLRASGSHA